MSPDKHSDFFKVLPDEELPIFSGKAEDLTLFYAPGFLAAAREKEAEEIRMILSGEYPFGNPIAGNLINAAAEACSAWAYDHSPDHYKPVCLTVYSSLLCNLNCSYCFASQSHEALRLDHAFLFENAGRVIANCREKGEPFTAVFHGGGEPALEPGLPRILTKMRQMCEAAEVPFRSYMATNGVIGENKARRVAEMIDMIGLSVDGPPEIQNRQRPFRSGGDTALIVERTAAIFRKIKGFLSVRVTILPENYSRMEEIAAYCSEILGADEIHIEPVYTRGSGPAPNLADEFCENYLKVKNALQQKGVRLTFSGSRIGEIHGRYCQIYRQVLHLVPPNACSACFALSSRKEVEQNGLLLQPDDFKAAFERLKVEDPACRDCFNRFHCARGCPDVCPALPGSPQDEGSFRCRISRTIAEAELLAAARSSLFESARRYGCVGIDLRGE